MLPQESEVFNKMNLRREYGKDFQNEMDCLYCFIINGGSLWKERRRETGKTRVIKVSHVFQTSEPTHIYISQAAERINERLKGQIEFQVYPNGELPSYKDAIEQVLRGSDFVSVVDPSYIGDYVPDFTALVGPMLYHSYELY